MKSKLKNIGFNLLIVISLLFVQSCGEYGDPGHCYVSFDWDYFGEDYRVYDYSDDNANVPEFDQMERKLYYSSYPGTYNYEYKAESPTHFYEYTGVYTLVQLDGLPGGLFSDGANGANTYLDVYLPVYADVTKSENSTGINTWEVVSGTWTIRFKQTVHSFRK